MKHTIDGGRVPVYTLSAECSHTHWHIIIIIPWILCCTTCHPENNIMFVLNYHKFNKYLINNKTMCDGCFRIAFTVVWLVSIPCFWVSCINQSFDESILTVNYTLKCWDSSMKICGAVIWHTMDQKSGLSSFLTWDVRDSKGFHHQSSHWSLVFMQDQGEKKEYDSWIIAVHKRCLKPWSVSSTE